ncbi:MAG: sigma-70 family RNA polymerase sigma factor [Flammeovirgaceae bacterium]|jgi:RNA polymerase sigma-70 factor (ECF subfamily)|nr:sigma-70 family RNA polymerase sigma factor [Flammeovirgaceae bacterium]
MFFRKRLAQVSDEELMRKVQSGNEAALTEIYQRYSVALLRYFTRMLWQDAELAQDFLQDLFLKVLDNPSRFDSSRNFSTWIFSCAHNMCKNEYRNRTNRESAVIPIERQNHTDLHKLIDERDFKDRLDLLLETLDEESKTLFLLRYEQELELTKISAILAIPIGTIKSRLFYLRKGLSQELNEYKIILKEGML